ncbi:MAG: TolC family protein [Nitrospiria bacterium]
MDHLKVIRNKWIFMGLSVIVLILRVTTLSNAEETNRPNENLDVLIEEALSKNPAVLAAKLRWEAAREETPQAKSLDDPQLTVTQWAIPSNFNLGDADETWYGIGQTFPFPGKLSLRGQISAKAAEAAEQEYLAKVREVVAEVKSAYYQLFLVHKMIDLHLEHQALLEEFIQIADQKYAVGQVSQQDSLKAHVELSKLHISLLVVEQEKVSVQAQINALINRPTETPLGQPVEPTYRKFDLTLEDLQQQALQIRPEIKAASFTIEKSEKAKNLARRNYLPDFMVEVMYWDVHTGENKWEAVGKINLPWVFKAKYDARVRQTVAEESQARANYTSIRNQTLSRLQDLFVKVKTSQELVEIYRNGVLPQAEQSLEAARISYQAGKVDFLNLIDSERALRDFQLEYYMALAQFEQQKAELERAVGRELRF